MLPIEKGYMQAESIAFQASKKGYLHAEWHAA